MTSPEGTAPAVGLSSAGVRPLDLAVPTPGGAVTDVTAVVSSLLGPGIPGRVGVGTAHAAMARLARPLVVCADALTVALAMVASHALLPALDRGADEGVATAYLRVGMLALPLWLVAFRRYRLYKARYVAGRRDEVVRVVHATGVGVLLTALVAHFLDLAVDRTWYAVLFVLASASVVAERELVRHVFGTLRRRGHCVRPVFIAGVGPEALALAQMFEDGAELGYSVIGLIGEPDQAVPGLAERFSVLEPDSKVADRVRLAGAVGVVLATTDLSLDTSNRLIRALTDAGIHVELSSSLRDIDATRLSVHSLGRFPVVYVEPVRRDGWRPAAKRSFDVVVSLVGLAAALPLVGLAALAIKLTSAGPVLYRQERLGYRGRKFDIIKMRSMYVDAGERLRALGQEASDGLIKLRHDPRVTPVGRVLRKLSLDEVPQLLNVLRGDMSLVGPRPQLVTEMDFWGPEVFERLRVRPGLTGMWQVSGRSQDRSDKDRWDLYYVDNWSMWKDLSILVRTIPVVVSTKGAY